MRVTLQFGWCAILICALSAFVSSRSSSSSSSRAAFAVETGTPLLHKFEDKYRSASTLRATFLERYRENGAEVRVESGKAYFLRPRKMRWEYEAPEKNLFLMDGKYVWFYAPADHSVTRVPAKQSDDWRTPLAFLTTGMKLSRICSKVDAAASRQPSQSGNVVYRCLLRGADAQDPSPNEGRDPGTVYFEVTTTGELAQIVIPQKGGRQIEFDFKDWEWNPKFPESLFRFDPPRGVAIVDGLLPETPGMRQ